MAWHGMAQGPLQVHKIMSYMAQHDAALAMAKPYTLVMPIWQVP